MATPAPHVSAAPATHGQVSEGSLIARFVTILTPVFAIAAAWLAGVVARHFPGVKLDTGSITAFMSAATISVAGIAWKWLEGWQRHEQRVSEGLAKPVKRDSVMREVPPGAS